MTALVGFLPAAGRGQRFSGGCAIKELYPIGLGADRRPICAFALDAIGRTGAGHCAIVIAPDKTEIRHALGGASRDGMPLAYFCQPEPEGVPNALRTIADWLGPRDVVLAFPDVVHFPENALAELHRRRLARGSDVMLGVFPVPDPTALGPVEFQEDGTVLRVHDKPRESPVKNSWGVASWSGKFTAFCAAWDEAEARRDGGERRLGHAFEAARLAGLRVDAHFFADGDYGDIGTPDGMRHTLEILRGRGRLAAES